MSKSVSNHNGNRRTYQPLERASDEQYWQSHMSNSASFAASTPHHFEIAQNGRGYWVAEDKEGLIGGTFLTEKDAFRFALFEVGGDRTCVRVLPPKSKRRRAGTSRNRR